MKMRLSNIKIISPVFCFLVDNPTSKNNILYIKWRQNDKDARM
jgi:hypothetical protein